MTQTGEISAPASKPPVPQSTAAATAHVPSEVELIIEPRRGWIAIDWSELLRHRELLYFLVWRDIKVRYKQAVLGVAWAVLQPAVQMVVFTLIFGVAAKLKNQLPPGLPYSVFVLSGLLPWQLFATSLGMGGMSLVNQQHLLTKIYFPRLFIPTAVTGGALLDLAVASLLFAVLLILTGVVPTWGVLLLPPLLLTTVVMSLGMAYLLSALTVTYRDFRFIIPFMVQIWMWVSFIAFPAAMVEESRWRWVLAFNPMYSIIAAYRKVLLGNYPGLTNAHIGWHPSYMVVSVALALGLFVLGLFYFRRTERRFADIA